MSIPNLNPLGYTGLKEQNPPNVSFYKKDPVATDITGFDIGDIWVNIIAQTAWMLLSKAGGIAVWQPAAGGAAQLSQLTPDVGGSVIPTAGNINIVGDNGITTTNLGASTIQVGNTNSFTTDLLGPTSFSAGNLTITGTNGIQTSSAVLGTITVDFTGQVPEDVTITDATAASTRILTVKNTDNTDPASSANIIASTGGAVAGDATYQASVTGTTTWTWGVDNSDSDSFGLIPAAALDPVNDVIKAYITGEIVKPKQPAFSAWLSADQANVTGDGTIYPIVFDTVEFNRGGGYNPATGEFTASVAGIYSFNFQVYLSDLGAANTSAFLMFYKSGVLLCENNWNIASTRTEVDHWVGGYSKVVSLAAGETISARVSVDKGLLAVDVNSGQELTFFSGYLVC